MTARRRSAIRDQGGYGPPLPAAFQQGVRRAVGPLRSMWSVETREPREWNPRQCSNQIHLAVRSDFEARNAVSVAVSAKRRESFAFMMRDSFVGTSRSVAWHAPRTNQAFTPTADPETCLPCYVVSAVRGNGGRQMCSQALVRHAVQGISDYRESYRSGLQPDTRTPLICRAVRACVKTPTCIAPSALRGLNQSFPNCRDRRDPSWLATLAWT